MRRPNPMGWAVTTALMFASAALAQAEKFDAVRTKEGCQIHAVVTPTFASIDGQGRPFPITREYSWNGACVAGTAYGHGLLRIQTTSGNAQLIEERRQSIEGGFPFGYEHQTYRSLRLPGGEPLTPASTSVVFRHGGKSVFFLEGHGIDMEPFKAGVSSVVIPELQPITVTTYGPGRDVVMAFIKSAKPEVDAVYARVRDAIGAGSSTASDRGGASAISANPIDVERLPVGALFAAADEAATRGDKAAARAALRALVRRFPDHPLATAAAKQLAAL